jgi:heme-degrading monooxygenase HmoA
MRPSQLVGRRAALALTCGALQLAACDDANGDTTPPADDPYDGAFAACTRAELEADMLVFDAQGNPSPPRWSGPAADPVTGELTLEPGSYFVSTTYLALRPEQNDAFFALLGPVQAALFSNPGMLAVQLGSSQSCATARTYTVWRDETAMFEFVNSDAHLAAIAGFPGISRGDSTVTSWAETSPAAITWEAALTQLASAAAYD